MISSFICLLIFWWGYC